MLHAPAALLPGAEPRYSLNRLQGQDGLFGEEKIHLFLPGIEPVFLCCSARSEVTYRKNCSSFKTVLLCHTTTWQHKFSSALLNDQQFLWNVNVSSKGHCQRLCTLPGRSSCFVCKHWRSLVFI